MKAPSALAHFLASIIAVVIGANSAAAAVDAPKLPPPAARAIDFAKDVQPILENHCYKCHGPKKQEAGFRLDDPAAAKKGGDTGDDIVPGSSAKSLLILAVAGATDGVSRMPEKGEPLSDEQIGILRAWIDQGAKYPAATAAQKKDPRDHWAFKAPVRPALPEVKDSSWPRSAIDRFVLARLDREGLKPSAEADKITLLRRLSLDLIGLPPSVAEVDAFLADTSADAYQKQVERLLASPHYGERWGRHWLDAARYADTDGFEKDKTRDMWFYRDWVIGALNRDLPYDRFIIEQLAGDQLPRDPSLGEQSDAAAQDRVVATGFLRNSMLNEEGGIDPEQFRMEAMFDRMDCIGKSVLGLTIQCCQCHNHKYDPITQEEYYRLFAFLNNDHAPQRVVYTPDELMKRESLVRQIREIEAGLQHRTPDWQEKMSQWEQQAAANQPAWEVLAPDDYEETGGGAKLSLLSDQSMLCAGYAPTHCTFRVVAKTKLARVTALRLEMLVDPNLPRGGPGRSFKGTFGLSEIKIEAAPADAPDKNKNTDKTTEIKIASASADYSQAESPLDAPFDDRSGKKRVLGPVAFAIDGKTETAWGIDTDPGRTNQDRKAVFQLAAPIEFPAGAIIKVSLVQNHGGWNSDDHQNNLLGRFRLSVTSAPAPVVADPLPKRVREILAIAPEKRTPAQTDGVFSAWRASVPEWREANDKIESLWRQWPTGATTLVLQARDEPRETSVLKRGDFLRPDNAVAAGVPSILHPLPEGAPPTRLSLARWLVDRRSPTTARVFVNRVWQAYFGTGIVATSEDFGVQSEPPSHPELLDWLACEFMDRGWRLKELHRLIVNSATYRQSSKVAPELAARDLTNRLLARGARFRVEGEVVRDVALSASGLLNPKMGGPSIFAPIPASLLTFSYAPLTWNEETGPDRYRRAVYTFRRRSLPYPALQNFDTPNGDFACVRRQRSNTPLQALTTLNEVIFMECAQSLARRTLAEGGSTEEERIRYAFRRCLSREPTEAERKELLDLIHKQLKRIAEGWLNPREIATGKNALPGELPKGATPAQLGAYTILARVILNLDETISRE